MQQQSHILVSSWVGICRDGGVEKGFRMEVVGLGMILVSVPFFHSFKSFRYSVN